MGNGLAMRAALTVKGLAQACNLTVAVVPVSDPTAGAQNLKWVQTIADQCFIAPLPDPAEATHRWIADPTGRAAVMAMQPLPERAKLACPDILSSHLGGETFDLIWTLRLYLAGAALQFRAGDSRLVLDVDEDEAATLGAIADLHQLRGEADAAARMTEDSGAFRRMADQTLPWFDQVITASNKETEALRHRYGLENISTVPNAVDIPDLADSRTNEKKPLSLLLIGNLDYLPNKDAAEQLVGSILPRIRERLPDALLHIVGAGKITAELAQYPGVETHGFVTDLAPLYAATDIAVVPLRAGGGSRLKILEAFAYGVPVVATAAGAAGLDVSDQDQLLIADSDVDFVGAVLRLTSDSGLSAGLTASAKRFVSINHNASEIAENIAKFATGKVQL